MTHPTTPAAPETHSTNPEAHGPTGSAFDAPADDKNPALLDAEHTFIVLIIGAALFIGAVFVFIL